MALLFRVLTILILLVFVFPRPILGLAKSSYAWSRDVSQLKAAILFKNNTRTTCEVALVTAKAGMVSANCLDFDNTGKLDTSTAYKVYIYDGPGTSTPIISTLDIADIHVHPSYNQDSLVYNIAVIQFNKDTADNFEQLLVSSYTVPEKSTFVLRSFNTIENKWNNFTSTTMPEENSDCDNYSGIYATNDAALLCTSATAPAAYKSTCDLPYGSLYMKDGDYVGIVALYSHSVILGEDVCTSDGTPQWRNHH
ncbi:hypothetical protein GGI07_000866 [Coemansia sp. Benny D115]|nr:hypothetical protein GGI07_000866 [Coemansia sp. Benny D115]